MNGDKIDLAEIETITRQWFGRDAHPVLALVRVVRAAREMEAVIARFGEDSFLASYEKCWDSLHAALSPFTDSAQESSDSAESASGVRSDD